jgi:hypothetical protein
MVLPSKMGQRRSGRKVGWSMKERFAGQWLVHHRSNLIQL